jgi:hypothetical protein
MDWLFEVTVSEMAEVGRDAETIPELRELIREYVQDRITKRQGRSPRCRGCNSRKLIVIDGADTCVVCGTSNMRNLSHCVSYNFNKNDYLKKKSRHNRVRWFNRLLVKHVANCDRRRLSNMFKDVVRCIERLGLERGRNIMRYKFYLLRLASMSKMELRNPPEDIKTQKLINIL